MKEDKMGINKKTLFDILEGVDDNAIIYIKFVVDGEMFIREITNEINILTDNVFLKTVDFN